MKLGNLATIYQYYSFKGWHSIKIFDKKKVVGLTGDLTLPKSNLQSKLLPKYLLTDVQILAF